MDEIESFINDCLKKGEVPRVGDIREFIKRKQLKPIKRDALQKLIQLNPIYTANVHQERDKLRSGKQRPIISNTLGHLHGDIGYYSVVRGYVTPKTFQYGFFVVKDILSRFIYVELMKGPKTATNLIKVMNRILLQHKTIHPDYNILSLSFDKERAMIGHKMEAFLLKKNIQLYVFERSVTKASVAENGIKLLRTDVQRLQNYNNKARWWDLLPIAADSLNKKEIVIRGKKTGYRPIDVNPSNVKKFIKKVHKLVPGYYFTQFNYPRQLTKFKFDIGDFVRPKTILSSTQVIGNKTSQVNLDLTRFKILDHYPFVTTDLSLRKLYKCINLFTEEIEIFAEEDLAISDNGRIYEKDILGPVRQG